MWRCSHRSRVHWQVLALTWYPAFSINSQGRRECLEIVFDCRHHHSLNHATMHCLGKCYCSLITPVLLILANNRLQITCKPNFSMICSAPHSSRPLCTCVVLLLGGELLAERCRTDDLPSIPISCLPPCCVDPKVLGLNILIDCSQVVCACPTGLLHGSSFRLCVS